MRQATWKVFALESRIFCPNKAVTLTTGAISRDRKFISWEFIFSQILIASIEFIVTSTKRKKLWESYFEIVSFSSCFNIRSSYLGPITDSAAPIYTKQIKRSHSFGHWTGWYETIQILLSRQVAWNILSSIRSWFKLSRELRCVKILFDIIVHGRTSYASRNLRFSTGDGYMCINRNRVELFCVRAKGSTNLVWIYFKVDWHLRSLNMQSYDPKTEQNQFFLCLGDWSYSYFELCGASIVARSWI